VGFLADFIVKGVKGNFTYVCPNCGKETPAFKKWRREKACGDCCNKYNFGRFTREYLLRLKD
jgi:ribosomal protein S27E